MFFSAATILIMNAAYLMLRVSNSSGTFPKPLSAVEEKKYIEQMLLGDMQARNILIEHNLRLVAHIIKKYYSASENQDDLISIGTIGLIKGISSFKSEKGTKLATYASRCIENEILMHFRSSKKTSSDISLSEPIDTDKDGNTLELMDIIYTDDDTIEKIYQNENYRLMKKYIVNNLDEQEREILILRYGLNNTLPMTQREVAKIKGISRSYYSVIIGLKYKTLDGFYVSLILSKIQTYCLPNLFFYRHLIWIFCAC